ncbi:hypothetical protein YC2023_095013 [Brassica napus]
MTVRLDSFDSDRTLSLVESLRVVCGEAGTLMAQKVPSMIVKEKPSTPPDPTESRSLSLMSYLCITALR